MKNLLEEIKLNKVAYLLEVIEKRDLNSKLRALNKLQKINITKNIGMFLIENSIRNFNKQNELEGINESLIELSLSNYYDEYSDSIKKVFDKLPNMIQNRIVYLLSTFDNKSALVLYSDLIVKYYKDKDFIPIGTLKDKPQAYTYIFPKLYKTLKFKNINNNILVLISNYLSYGVVPKNDIKKYKKDLINSINNVFESALKFKFKNTFEALNNAEYKDLRYFLEKCINIEIYVSNKKTREYLEKLYKKNDNQLKLFILDNYYRRGVEIDKLNLNKIANDISSRYALFELLSIYEKTDLFPKKFLNQQSIAVSDFYINFVISSSYMCEPKNIKFYKKYYINNYEYYVFKFDCTYKYNNLNKDFLTNYICNIVGIDKLNGENVTSKFIGISGGYLPSKNVSLVKQHHDNVLYSKIDNNSNIDDIVNNIIPKIEIQQIENKKQEKKINIFSIIILFLLLIIVFLLIYCVICVYSSSNNTSTNNNLFKSVKIDKNYTFSEIDGHDIFNKPESEYYVLFYKKTDNSSNKYFYYINNYLKRNIKFYYVNLNDEKNKFLYSQNDINFVLGDRDRLLRVKDKEYEYFIDGKNNILNEMKKEIDKYIESEKQQSK